MGLGDPTKVRGVHVAAGDTTCAVRECPAELEQYLGCTRRYQCGAPVPPEEVYTPVDALLHVALAPQGGAYGGYADPYASDPDATSGYGGYVSTETWMMQALARGTEYRVYCAAQGLDGRATEVLSIAFFEEQVGPLPEQATPC